MEFYGYLRPDGQVGTRNYIGIIPSVFCAERVAEQIREMVPGSVLLRHPLGCSQVGEDLEITGRTLIAMGRHPNLAAVLVVGLGCERFTPDELVKGIAGSGKPVEKVVIQDEGDTIAAVAKGVRLVKSMMSRFAQQKRVPADISKLTVAVKCGGTDATSGIAANPAVGNMSDRLIDLGGSVIFSEVTELLGAEHLLAARAVSPEVRKDILDTVGRMEEKLRQTSNDPRFAKRSALISTGNFDGGVSTVAEKALGNIYKSGSRAISGVLPYATPACGTGLYLMDSPGHDGEVVTGMVGAGAQIVVFTSGRGTPTGFPFVPVVKVTGNSRTFEKMRENIDVNAGPIIDESCPIETIGQQLFETILDTANGTQTKAELLGHNELFCITRK
ncbi:UxaA family hydrolase [Oscillibacter sp. MSJ-2]|uniref:UxaA family hydrolase n=1 Tax=Dysosmobacter acutus TaxID=2841504 RepID=A0ABS6F9W6_9FIRM|nr:UxaA family hydrolase [Dysosmobacter acutus]MBU5626125.1 UxaA family hydrolase [Dysosmobacter acutus]